MASPPPLEVRKKRDSRISYKPIHRGSDTTRGNPFAVLPTIRLATRASWLFLAMFSGTGACAWASARADTSHRSIAPRRTRHKPRFAVPKEHIAFRSPNRCAAGCAANIFGSWILRVQYVIRQFFQFLGRQIGQGCVRSQCVSQDLTEPSAPGVFFSLASRFLPHERVLKSSGLSGHER